MSFVEQMYVELIRAGVGLFLLLVTWFFGQRIIAYWDVRKKQQELDIAISTKFQQLYGEFKEVSKLWRTFFRKTYRNRYEELSIPEDVRWELLKRAAAAESGLETILVKLATESAR